MLSLWLGLTVERDGVPDFKTLNCSADQQNAPVSEYQMWCWRPEGHTTMLQMQTQRTPRMSENPANSRTCSWQLPEEDKEVAQNWSVCWNFLGWWYNKKKAQLLNWAQACNFTSMVSCMSHIALKGAFHTKSTCLGCSSLLSERKCFSSQHSPS